MKTLLSSLLAAAMLISAAHAAPVMKRPLVRDGWVRCAIAKFRKGPLEKRWNAEAGWLECRMRPKKPKGRSGKK